MHHHYKKEKKKEGNKKEPLAWGTFLLERIF